MRIAIIGAGPAGITAALKITSADKNVRCTVFTEESYNPYSPPLLYDYFLRDFDIFWKGSNFSAFDLKTATRIVHIDRDRQCLHTGSRQKFYYDKLIIATGAALHAPIPETTYNNVHNFKSLTDAVKLIRDIKNSRSTPSVIVVGSGFIGIEIALLLCKLNAKVTILEKADQILPDMADSEIALRTKGLLEQAGITVHLKSEVLAFYGFFKAKKVLLENGPSIKADYFVVATGIKPDVFLAKTSGLKTNWGICVDDHLKTSDDSIYAIGDCAELTYDNITGNSRHANFLNAIEQAQICTANILGNTVSYQRPPRSNSIKHLSVPLLIGGTKTGVRHIWQNCNQMRIVYVKDQKVSGFQLFNSDSAAGILNSLLRTGKDITHYLHHISSPHLTYPYIG